MTRRCFRIVLVCVVGLKVWSSERLQVSTLCLMWMRAEDDEMLLSGGSDNRLRVWERQRENAESLVLIGSFGVQKGPILALAQNTTHVASASGQSCVLCLLCICLYLHGSNILCSKRRNLNHVLLKEKCMFVTSLLN